MVGMDNFYVYMYLRTKDSINGHANSPYYIGKGHGRRAFQKHGNVPLPKGPDRIIVVYENLSEAEANLEEKRLIMVYGRIDKGTGCLRNRTDGGEGQCGIVWKPESLAKISAALKGVPKSPTARTRGPRSPEVIAAMREGQNKRYAKCGGVGRIMTDEIRQKISVAKKGIPCSEETRRKLSQSANRELLRKINMGNRNATRKRAS
jgi:hypothetical protein